MCMSCGGAGHKICYHCHGAGRVADTTQEKSLQNKEPSSSDNGVMIVLILAGLIVGGAIISSLP